MTKPADIPQRVWDEIEGLVEAVQHHSIDGKEEIARAILAAEQREREACIAIAASMMGEGSGIEPASVKWVRAYRNAIRNRSQDQ